ncbi:MAG: hypothetical protein AB3N16_12840 [Flavobacteriaceae bacterium]
MNFNKFCLYLLGCLFISCSSKNTIATVIGQIENKDFSIFDDISITYRSSDISGNQIFMLAKSKSNCRPYIIEYNSTSGEIFSLSDELVLKSKSSDKCALKEEKVRELFNIFIDLDFRSLVKDSSGLYIEPKNIERPLVIFRPNSEINEGSRYRGKLYERFDANWFVSVN